MMDGNARPSLFGADADQAVLKRGRGTSGSACVFCDIIRGAAKATVVDEGENLISFLDHRPVFRGHTLLVPKLHVQLLSDLPADRVEEFFLEAQRLERAVELGLGADGSA